MCPMISDGYDDWHQEQLTFIRKIDPVSKMNNIIEILQDRKKFSPDFGKQRLLSNILIFVYDSMKKGGQSDTILKDTTFLGLARTTLPNYLMNIYGNHRPVVMDHNRKEFGGYIRGEVYAISPLHLLEIDKAKLNGFVFKRQQRSIQLLDQSYPSKKGPVHPCVQAWIYFGIPEAFESAVACRVSPATFNDKGKRVFDYYCRPFNPIARHPSANNVLWGEMGDQADMSSLLGRDYEGMMMH